jgi:hydrogenase maturation factor
MSESSKKYRVAKAYHNHQLRDTVSFGGEYSFAITDDMATTLDRLFRTGCDIGGLAWKADDNTIRVRGCYNPGYWELRYDNPSEGVSTFTIFVPADGVAV